MVLHAFIDISGNINDKDGMFFVGIISDSGHLESISSDWQDALKERTLKYLHATETIDRDTLLDFAKIVRKLLSHGSGLGLCVSVDCAAYQAMPSHLRQKLKKPELIAFEIFIGAALALGQVAMASDFQLALLCDDTYDSERFAALLRQSKERNAIAKDHISMLCFCDDKKVPAVQIADLLAYACRSNGFKREPSHPLFRAVGEGNMQLNRIHLDGELFKELATHTEIRPIDYFVKVVKDK